MREFRLSLGVRFLAMRQHLYDSMQDLKKNQKSEQKNSHINFFRKLLVNLRVRPPVRLPAGLPPADGRGCGFPDCNQREIKKNMVRSCISTNNGHQLKH